MVILMCDLFVCLICSCLTASSLLGVIGWMESLTEAAFPGHIFLFM